jgi:hypothetical protein
MKRIALLLMVFAALPTLVEAQASASIERAVLAAPARSRADATVLDLRPDGTIAVLRQGTNGYICYDNVGKPGVTTAIDSQCTTEANRARLEQNHAFNSAGGTEAEIKARFDRAEADGTRKLSQFGSIYYHVTGDSPQSLRSHTTVAVPNATAATLGLPDRAGPAMLWLMEAGTSSAHLMVSGM